MKHQMSITTCELHFDAYVTLNNSNYPASTHGKRNLRCYIPEAIFLKKMFFKKILINGTKKLRYPWNLWTFSLPGYF